MAGIDVWIWVAVIALTLIVEYTTTELVSIWFSAAGFVSLILSAFSLPFEVQIIVFVVLSMSLLISLRKITKNKLLNSTDSVTNLDMIKKERFQLITPITESEPGSLKYNGVVWTAISKKSENIDAGVWVVVSEIKGTKLIVEKEKEGK